jgi:hypothetical protein
MKFRITNPDGEVREYPGTALEQQSTAALFALQRVTGKVMPKGLEELREAGDALTLTYYTVWMVLWKAGDRTDLEALFECEIEAIPEEGDEVAAAEEAEDPTPAPTASDRGESADAA